MADDRMKTDDLQKNVGGAGRDEGQNPGQQAPGRSGQAGQPGQQAGTQQKPDTGQKTGDMKDENPAAGKAQSGGQNR